MKNFIFIGILTVVNFSFAQKWIKDGSEWHYTSYGEGLELYHQAKYVGDTTISGYEWQLVKNEQYTYWITGPEGNYQVSKWGTVSNYFRMSSDTLFMFSQNQYNQNDSIVTDNIAFIFKDSAKWERKDHLLNNYCVIKPVYQALYKSTPAVNGIDHDLFELREINPTDSSFSEFYSIVSSRYGGDNIGFFGLGCEQINGAMSLVSTNLVCYQDNEDFSIKNTTNDCDYFLSLSTNELATQAIQIFPNPTNETFAISSEFPIEYVKCYDFQGREVSLVANQNNTSFSVQNLAKGVYLLEIHTANSTKVERLIVN
ncbi:MAG TPA: T9SS type A sorting domain-containing protein [Crocinitomicaceae bacterium]|nr:T9SS type A sorting domain-containing protein [Crocinitomicaceae bacterium]